MQSPDVQKVLPEFDGDPGKMRDALAAARSRLLRQYVGLDSFTLERTLLWPNTTPAQALARAARRDDDAACAIERLLGRPGHGASIPSQNPATNDALSRALAARSRLLSAAARLALDKSHGAMTPAFHLLATCRDHDLRWSGRLDWWNEEQHIPFEVGPTEVLLAAVKAARKELLTALALLPPSGRPAHQNGLLSVTAGEREVLQLRGDRTPQGAAPPADAPWTQAWRQLHDVHHALVASLQARISERLDPETYRSVTRAIDRDRALAIAVRAGRPTAARSQLAVPMPRTDPQ